MREWITGRNAAYEVLVTGKRDIFQLKIAAGAEVKGKLADIVKLAEKRRVRPVSVPRKQLDQIDENHQGMALEVSGFHYSDLQEAVKKAQNAEEPYFFLLLDVIQNPQNLGTLVRSAEAAGVHGVVIPLARSAEVTPAVVHASVGATEHMHIIQMNLSQAIDELHDLGVWVVGLDGGAGSTPVEPKRLKGNIAIVVGSEGDGLRQLTRKQCDEIIALPMRGQIESLNAAVAGSIVVYLSYMERK